MCEHGYAIPFRNRLLRESSHRVVELKDGPGANDARLFESAVIYRIGSGNRTGV